MHGTLLHLVDVTTALTDDMSNYVHFYDDL